MLPVKAPGSVALQGPWLPDSVNAWYIPPPAFTPASPVPVARSLGVIVPPLNKPGAAVVFDVPKVQTAIPLTGTLRAEVSVMALFPTIVPVVSALIGIPPFEEHGVGVVSAQVPLYMIPTMVALAAELNVKAGANGFTAASPAVIVCQ